jgi:hypothetical protein
MKTDKRCKFVKPNGEQCQSWAINGSDYCFWHSSKKKGKAASSKGGRQGKRKVVDKSDLSLRSLNEVVELLELTINEVRTGKIDVRIANSVGYLGGILIKALENSDLDERLSKLEQKVFK